MAEPTDKEVLEWWVNKSHQDQDHIISQQRAIQDLTDQLRIKDYQIKELETDYVKQLENQIAAMREQAKLARQHLLDVVNQDLNL